MDILDPTVNRYLRGLAARDDEPVLLEMEALADERGFPIIGRLCGQLLELVARSVGATRIFELGSGFGYSAYWFSRATGAGGEIHLTDTDPANEKQALDFLTRAGLAAPIHYHVSDALAAFSAVDGDFDVVYCDINKTGYPDAWKAGRERVRVGGLYISDNMLWSGRVTEVAAVESSEDTRAIHATNEAIAADDRFVSVIVPLRDGVTVALRIE